MSRILFLGSNPDDEQDRGNITGRKQQVKIEVGDGDRPRQPEKVSCCVFEHFKKATGEGAL